MLIIKGKEIKFLIVKYTIMNMYDYSINIRSVIKVKTNVELKTFIL